MPPVQAARAATTQEEINKLRISFNRQEALLRQQLANAPDERTRLRLRKTQVGSKIRQIIAARSELRESEKRVQQAKVRGITPQQVREGEQRSLARDRAEAARNKRIREAEELRKEEKPRVTLRERGTNRVFSGRVEGERVLAVRKVPVSEQVQRAAQRSQQRQRFDRGYQSPVTSSIIENLSGRQASITEQTQTIAPSFFKPGVKRTTTSITGTSAQLSLLAGQPSPAGELTLIREEYPPSTLGSTFLKVKEQVRRGNIALGGGLTAEQAKETFNPLSAQGQLANVELQLGKLSGFTKRVEERVNQRNIQLGAKNIGFLAETGGSLFRTVRQEPIQTGAIFTAGLATSGVGGLLGKTAVGSFAFKTAGIAGGTAFTALSAQQLYSAPPEDKPRVLGRIGRDVLAFGAGYRFGQPSKALPVQRAPSLKGQTKLTQFITPKPPKAPKPPLNRALIVNKGVGGRIVDPTTGKTIASITMKPSRSLFGNKRGSLRTITLLRQPRIATSIVSTPRAPQLSGLRLPGLASGLGFGLGSLTLSRLASQQRGLTEGRLFQGQSIGGSQAGRFQFNLLGGSLTGTGAASASKAASKAAQDARQRSFLLPALGAGLGGAALVGGVTSIVKPRRGKPVRGFFGPGSRGGRRSRRRVSPGRRSFRAVPSLVAVTRRIKGRLGTPRGGFTGLEIRPVRL